MHTHTPAENTTAEQTTHTNAISCKWQSLRTLADPTKGGAPFALTFAEAAQGGEGGAGAGEPKPALALLIGWEVWGWIQKKHPLNTVCI